MAPTIGIDHARRRILLVTPQPYYEDRGTPIAIRQLLEALTQLDYDVDVLAFPLGSSPSMKGVRILRASNPLGITGVPIGFSWRKVALDLSLAAALRRLLKDPGYACVHAVEEAAYVAAWLNARSGPPLIYDMASTLPGELSAHLMFRLPGCATLIRRLERYVLNRVDHVVCSPGLGSYVRQRTTATPVTEWRFPGGGFVVDEAARRRQRAELGIGEQTVACVYTGSFARYQGLDIVADALPDVLAEAPDTVFVLVGTTDDDQRAVDRFLRSECANSLRIVPRQPRDSVAGYLAAADILLSPRASSRNTPLKIFDYLATGKPILASAGDAHRMIGHHRQVRLFTHTAEGFARALLELLATGKRDTVVLASTQREAWAAFRCQIKTIYDSLVPKAAGRSRPSPS